MSRKLSETIRTIAFDNEWLGTQYQTALDWADEVAVLEAKLEGMRQALSKLDAEWHKTNVRAPVMDTSLGWFIRLAVEAAQEEQRDDV